MQLNISKMLPMFCAMSKYISMQLKSSEHVWGKKVMSRSGLGVCE